MTVLNRTYAVINLMLKHSNYSQAIYLTTLLLVHFLIAACTIQVKVYVKLTKDII